MALIKLALCILAVSVPAYGSSQKWYSLRTTWKPNPFSSFAFDHQPRTIEEAQNKGWVEIINHCDTGKFAGRRMIRSVDDLQMVLLFDKNGFIAGFQSVVPVEDALDSQYYNFKNNSMYQPDTIYGRDVFLTTAYFVDVNIICYTGRTQAEFDTYGTGDRLTFQNGPNFAGINILSVPMTEKEAVKDPQWFKHKCLVNMGNHFFTLDHSPDQDCRNLFPVQLLYEDNELKGFVWQHTAKLKGDRFEQVNEFAISAIVDRPPDCLKPLTSKPGVSTMHIYFKDYEDLCFFN